MPAYRDFEASPLQRLLRVLARNFRIGSLFGVEVRMYWVAAIVMPLLFLQWFSPIAATALELLVLTVAGFVSLFTIVWSHEMGHIWWGRRYGIHTPLITLSPLGGVAHMGAATTTPRSDALVALAGPSVHLLWLAVCWPLQLLIPYGTFAVSGWATDPVCFGLLLLVQTNQFMLLFNLLPCFPMDGGRVLRAVLAMRLHPNRATMIATAIGIGAGVLMILYGFASHGAFGSILVFIGISNIAACVDERRVARHSLIYGEVVDSAREAWQSDPDAWRRGEDPFGGGGEAKPRPARRLDERQGTVVARRAPPDDLDEQVDKVLERVHEVGLGGLTAAERKVLERASKRHRGAS